MTKKKINFLSQFGTIQFGEENNLCLMDYERSLKKFFTAKKSRNEDYFRMLNFAEIDNPSLQDFNESFTIS